ncbi:MAG TPA: aquaporin [Candidatus Saccharimonadales bacterium]|jgi:glycerol uptake facilitator-like aquaporin|nr:aquaporin [Candidatus Saccharimonadales bacterium]
MFGKKKVAMILAEFLGTGVLTLVVLAVAKSTIGLPYFVDIAAGLTIATMTVVFAKTSGAHFNPAITLGLWSARQIKTVTAVVYVAVQLLGGICAYWLYTYFSGSHWANSGHFNAKIMVAEAVGTLIFSFGWATAVYQKLEVSRAAFAVGAALTLGAIVASAASIGFLNPAVALGARQWGWGTYVLGPVLGSVVGFNLYALLFAERTPGNKPPLKTNKKKS